MTVVIVARHPSELLPPVSVDALVVDWDDVSVLRRRPGRGDNLSGALPVAHADGAQSRTDLLREVIKHVHRLPTAVITARRRDSFIKEMRDRRVDLGRSVIVRRAHDVPAELHHDAFGVACQRLGVAPSTVQIFVGTDDGISCAITLGASRIIDVRSLPRRRSNELSEEDDRLVQLAVTWTPYGGPPAEDIFVGFGLTESQYFRRLQLVLLHTRLGSQVESALWQRVLTMCERRRAAPFV